MSNAPKTKYLKDYTLFPYAIDAIDLHFSLHEDATRVRSRLVIRKTIATAANDLVLDGHGLELLNIEIDASPLPENQYTLSPESLIIHSTPETFTLSIETEIKPQENTSLEGLYKSNGMYCTQCEAEGFRKITFFPDRPDVLAIYTVTIEADKAAYPLLLANGNFLTAGEVSPTRHYAKWADPFRKPCYLFALVAGNLAVLEDRFTTKSGRTIRLQIYTEQHNADKCGHAMASLKKAMAWDEVRFNLEIDLDQYMIVAVDDFNAGAMENKGLNVFNSRFVLANPQTATDADYEGIESVIAHEYFHNWTGNRVTCRDWFQLSLKEGLTVFRDQEFTSDTHSRAIKRIEDVTFLRNHQFPEDAGPMAHPIRPESYIEINNFYTLTVYEKGAEVIRMLHTILGEKLFQEGVALYIQRHDGEAATTDDFVQAMEDVLQKDNGLNKPANLHLFKRWYSQAGTPVLTITSSYDKKDNAYTLIVEQLPADIKGQKTAVLHIPLAVGLISTDGHEFSARLEGELTGQPEKNHVLHITEASQIFRFTGLDNRPIPSLLRHFSAPVKLNYDYSDDELCFLILHDTDSFNRWEAGQRLFTKHLLACAKAFSAGQTPFYDGRLTEIFTTLLQAGAEKDKAFIAQVLSLPTEDFLAEQVAIIDVDAIHNAREFIRNNICEKLAGLLKQTYTANCSDKPYTYDPKLAGQRRLKNLCLNLLLATSTPEAEKMCKQQFEQADNMTDEIAALKTLVHAGCESSQPAVAAFFNKWCNESLVLDKWFSVQATAPLPETFVRVQKLLDHSHFNIKNPNKVRALIGSFAAGNPVCFHDKSGQGYTFLADQVLRLDPLNPNIASRLMGRLSHWRRYDSARQELMQEQIKRVLSQVKLSNGVYEIASKSLEN
jgi:aminopeptidase N